MSRIKDFAAAAGDPGRRRDAVVYLGTHPEAAKNAKLDLATLEAMLPLVGPTEHTARGTLAERGFVIKTKENPNWEKASGFILILDDPGVLRNLGALSEKEAKSLAKGARLAGRGEDKRLMEPLRQKIRRDPGQLFGTVTAQWNRTTANLATGFGAASRDFIAKQPSRSRPIPTSAKRPASRLSKP
jgi:hypothetical protein